MQVELPWRALCELEVPLAWAPAGLAEVLPDVARQWRSQMDKWSFTRAEIASQCRRFGPLVHAHGLVDLDGNPVDGVRLMWAFALKESLHLGDDILGCPPRFEIAYFEGRYSKEPWQAGLNENYGPDGAKSYGPWQVMLCNCKGYAPYELHDLEKCALCFLGFINRLIESQKPTNIMQVADAYNSGNWRDWIVPDAYIKAFVEYYMNGQKWPMPEAA